MNPYAAKDIVDFILTVEKDDNIINIQKVAMVGTAVVNIVFNGKDP